MDQVFDSYMGACDKLNPLHVEQRYPFVDQEAYTEQELQDFIVAAGRIYQLMKDSLQRLALGVGEPSVVHVHCVVRLLRLAGFQPQVDQCTSCSAQVHTAGYWSVRQGGLLCQQCLHEDPRAQRITPETLAAFEALAQSDQPPPIDARLIPELRRRLDEFLRWRLDRPLKTLAT